MKTSPQCIKSQYSVVGVQATDKAEEALAWREQALGNRTSDYIEKSESSRISLRSLEKRPSDWNRALPTWRGKKSRKVTFRIVSRHDLSTEGINSKLKFG